MDDTPIIVTVVASVHIIPSQWEETYGGAFVTREEVVADVRSYFECDETTGTAQRILAVSEDGPAFPPGMRGTTTGHLKMDWSVTDPQ